MAEAAAGLGGPIAYAEGIARSDQILAASRAQQQSSPPPAAREYNDALVRTFGLYSQLAKANAVQDDYTMDTVIGQLQTGVVVIEAVENETVDKCA